jgi:ParB family chromosome partitioning protein
MATKKTVKKPKAARRKKVEARSKGLHAKEMKAELNGLQLSQAIEADGGTVVGAYKEPINGKDIVIAALPIEKVEPTPYQRDRSEAHVKKLAIAMEKVGYFLDPIITVRRSDGVYWTPNGNHRLGAMQLLGHKSIVSLVIPEEDTAYKILALNTEKAHNLKERSLEVIRMLRGLVEAKQGNESDFIAFLEEPHFATIGAAYEKRPRFSAGAYAPVVKRLEAFMEEPLKDAYETRLERADLLLKWDDEVNRVVEALKEKGMQSPFLRNYVVARVNFLRFKKEGDFEFDETIQKLIDATKKIDPSKVNKEDLAKVGGAPAEAEE